MTTYSVIIAALAVALLFTLLFALLGSRGPWGSGWTLFLVLFLALWATGLYISPIGPVYWGIPWVPLIFAGIVFAILLIAVMPRPHKYSRRIKDKRLVDVNGEPNDREIAGATIGLFLWLLIVLFIAAIVVGSFVRVY